MLLGESLKQAFEAKPHAIDSEVQPDVDHNIGFTVNGSVFVGHLLNGEMNVAKTVGSRTVCLKKCTKHPEDLFTMVFLDGDTVAVEKLSYSDLDKHGESVFGAAIARLVYKASESVVTDIMGLKIA